MALNRSEKINLVQMAMKRVNVVPYGENQIAFGTNQEKIILGESAVTVCEAYINIPDEKHTCHIGFSTLLSKAVNSNFYIEVDGNERSKIYKNTNKTMQYFDLFLLGKGLHSIMVKATAESSVEISPREAQLGVYL